MGEATPLVIIRCVCFVRVVSLRRVWPYGPQVGEPTPLSAKCWMGGMRPLRSSRPFVQNVGFFCQVLVSV